MADREPPHAWRWEDDVVAYYLFRAGTGEITLDEVESTLGIGPAAMRMRIANFKALDGGAGLKNTSRQSRAMFEKHKSTPDAELRETVLRILRADGSVDPASESLPSRGASENRRAEFDAIRAEMRECLERSFQITVGYVTFCVVIMAYGFSAFPERGPIFVLPIVVVWLGRDLWGAGDAAPTPPQIRRVSYSQ